MFELNIIELMLKLESVYIYMSAAGQHVTYNLNLDHSKGWVAQSVHKMLVFYCFSSQGAQPG